MKLSKSWIAGKELKNSELIAEDYSIELFGKSEEDCSADIEILVKTPGGEKSVYKISGQFDEVFDAAIDFLGSNDILQEKSFIYEIDQAKFNFNKKVAVSDQTTPKEIGYNLRKLLLEKNLSVKDFAKATDKNSGNIYRELKGDRPISIDQAINYSKALNCDPVKILFKDLRTKIWGNTDTCNSMETYRHVDPCEIFVRLKEEQKSILVPRDIYQENIECFKIASDASSLNNHYVFYYKSFEKNFVFNKQVVIGLEYEDDFLGSEYRYFFGILENYRGQINLINPDPYKKGAIVLENINRQKVIFVSEVIAILNQISLRRSNKEIKIIKARNLLELESLITYAIKETQSLIYKIKKQQPNNKEELSKALKMYKQSMDLSEKLKKQITKFNLIKGDAITDEIYNSIFKSIEVDEVTKNISKAYERIAKVA